MRVAGRALGWGGLPCLAVLILASGVAHSAPSFSQADSPAVVDPVKTEVRARLQTLGGWNVRMNAANGSLTALFDFTPGQPEPFFFSFDGDDGYSFSIGDPAATVTRDDDDFINSLIIFCRANAPGTAAQLSIESLSVPLSTAAELPQSLSVAAGGQEFKAFKISNAEFDRGFDLGGFVTLDFPEPGVSAAELTCEWLAVDDNAAAADRDGDLVFDKVDNCPRIFNPLQEDQDGDGEGDVCDICIDVFNPGQPDPDGDGQPDACDICPQGCELLTTKKGATCQPSVPGVQLDSDNDGFGDTCDNCAFVPNGILDEVPQADFDGDGIGDACEFTNLNLSFTGTSEARRGNGNGPPAQRGLESSFLASPLSGVEGSSAQPSVTSTDFGLGTECGPRTISVANYSISIPPSVLSGGTVDFSGCTASDCTGSSLDPTVFDLASSFAVGPNIGGGVPADVFHVHLEGAQANAPNDEAICFETDTLPTPSGTLSLTNLGLDEQPILDPAGLTFLGVDGDGDTVPDGLPQYIEDDGTEVAPELTTTTNVAGDERAVLLVTPAIDAVGAGDAAVTLESDFLVSAICYGLRAAGDPGTPVYSGCTATAAVDGVTFRTCSDGGGSNTDMGPGVKDSGSAPLLETYVLDANSTSTIPNLLANTTYVVQRGDFFSLSGNVLNRAGLKTLLGTYRADGTQSQLPALTFSGCSSVLAHIGDSSHGVPVVSASLDASNVTLGGGFDPDEDTDGDTLCDGCDNCPNVANFTQDDDGRPGEDLETATQPDDGVGNVCQCGDSEDPTLAENPGSVTLGDDLEGCQQAQLGDGDIRCSVEGGPGIDSSDIYTMAAGLDASVSGLSADDIRQVCQPAVVAPSP